MAFWDVRYLLSRRAPSSSCDSQVSKGQHPANLLRRRFPMALVEKTPAVQEGCASLCTWTFAALATQRYHSGLRGCGFASPLLYFTSSFLTFLMFLQPSHRVVGKTSVCAEDAGAPRSLGSQVCYPSQEAQVIGGQRRGSVTLGKLPHLFWTLVSSFECDYIIESYGLQFKGANRDQAVSIVFGTWAFKKLTLLPASSPPQISQPLLTNSK